MSEPIDHAKARAEIAPLTDALVNIVTELALLTPVQRSTVLRMINAAYAVPEPSTSPLDWYRNQPTTTKFGPTYGEGWGQQSIGDLTDKTFIGGSIK